MVASVIHTAWGDRAGASRATVLLSTRGFTSANTEILYSDVESVFQERTTIEIRGRGGTRLRLPNPDSGHVWLADLLRGHWLANREAVDIPEAVRALRGQGLSG